MALQAGTRLGPYEILAPLGAGGMGEVYWATDARLRREVAVNTREDPRLTPLHTDPRYADLLRRLAFPPLG